MLKQVYVPGDADTSTGPSPALWANCPIEDFLTDPSKGVYLWDDFHGPLLANNQASTPYGQFQAYTSSTSGSDIVNCSTTACGGAVTLETTTDNEGVAIRSQPAFKIDLDQGKLWFEARIKQVNITDSKYNVFCGLIEAGTVSTSIPLTTSDAVSDNNLVGFQRVFADGDKLDTTYKADSVTQVTVGADAITTVADTWVKVGMYFDGEALYFYKNGVVLSDHKHIPTGDGTDFPNDVALGFVFAIMAGHGDDCSASIDWIRIAQERVS